jgi:hypothetical protein
MNRACVRLIPRVFTSVAARQISVAALLALALFGAAASASAEEVMNLTGLPAYPNLSRAKMDSVARTDMLGHWCNRFAGYTFDPVEVVEKWYRKALLRASETDLKNDERYRNFDLSGIKLAVGIDYVTVYKMADQPSTIIELFRCSPPS